MRHFSNWFVMVAGLPASHHDDHLQTASASTVMAPLFGTLLSYEGHIFWTEIKQEKMKSNYHVKTLKCERKKHH